MLQRNWKLYKDLFLKLKAPKLKEVKTIINQGMAKQQSKLAAATASTL